MSSTKAQLRDQARFFEDLDSVNALGKRFYDNAAAHGFHDADGKPEEDAGHRLLLIVTEIAEAYEHVRKGHAVTEIFYVDGKPDGVPIELADVAIRLLEQCYAWDIDLASALLIKHTFNLSRPHMHGDKIL